MNDYSARNIEAMDLLVSQIAPSSLNPRKHFDEEALQELADSIKEHGLLEPIVVRRKRHLQEIEKEIVDRLNDIRHELTRSGHVVASTGFEDWVVMAPGCDNDLCCKGNADLIRNLRDEARMINKGVVYEIIAGERRWRASQIAELEMVPCRIMSDIDDKKALELALVENLVRRDIDPIEEAYGYRQLSEMGYKQADIAEKCNRSQPAVANAIRLLDLPAEVHQHIRDGKISVSHARALLQYSEYPELFAAQIEFALSGATTKDLEKFSHSRACTLERKKLVIYSWPNEDKFDREIICAECRHRKIVDEFKANFLCLNPCCYKKKTKEAMQQAKEAALEKAKQNEDIPKTEDLKGCKTLDWRPPEACKIDCENRVKAKDWKGDVIDVCINPECWTQLRDEQDAREKEEKLRLQQEKYLHVVSLIDQANGYIKALVPVCHNVIRSQSADNVDAVAKRLGIKINTKAITDYNTKIIDAYKMLEDISPVVLIRLAAESMMLGEINRGYRDESIKWFIGESEEPAEDETDTPGDGPFDAQEDEEDPAE